MIRAAAILCLLGLGACKEKVEPAPDAPPSATSVQAASIAAGATSPSIAPQPSGAPATGNRVEWIEVGANADFASTVRLERAKAQRAGRMLVVYVGADWCPPCKAFHEAVLAHQLDDKLGKMTFLVFDFDRDAAKMGAFGYQTTHIPYFVRPGPDGVPDGAFNIKTLNKPQAVSEASSKLLAWQNAK